LGCRGALEARGASGQPAPVPPQTPPGEGGAAFKFDYLGNIYKQNPSDRTFSLQVDHFCIDCLRIVQS
jgi:hypothetical protein